MTNQNLFDSALRMICEIGAVGENADYSERAEYLLACACSECLSLDKKYRKANALPAGSSSIAAKLLLNEQFPLSDVFVTGITYYLAAMLVVEENETMSERFFDLYTDAMASIACELPMTSSKITNKYPDIF